MSSEPPSPETVRAADLLEGIQDGVSHGPDFHPVWIVDAKSWKAVRLALADRIPIDLKFVTYDDPQEKALSIDQIAAVASTPGAERCSVKAHFYDSFYSPSSTDVDVKRLEALLANEKLHISSFYGHLDERAIERLPRTINTCGLAIGTAADAETLDHVLPWLSLAKYFVSVSSNVAVEDLRKLPVNLDHPQLVKTNTRLGLVFPHLVDARVNFVRAAIEVLVPRKRIQWLDFPKCGLTSDGARELVKALHMIEIRESVTIESIGTWQPDAAEKESLAQEYNTGAQDIYNGSPRYIKTDWNFA